MKTLARCAQERQDAKIHEHRIINELVDAVLQIHQAPGPIEEKLGVSASWREPKQSDYSALGEHALPVSTRIRVSSRLFVALLLVAAQ